MNQAMELVLEITGICEIKHGAGAGGDLANCVAFS